MAQAEQGEQPLKIRRHILVLMLGWTVATAVSLSWNVVHVHSGMLELARTQTRVAHARDVLYRRWNAVHGGVYVPVTASTRPNPYLAVKERELRTSSGRILTLVNPAYMTRQVHTLAHRAKEVGGHITSLRPIRPANAPDAWEKQALMLLARRVPEVSEVQVLNGQRQMRLMRPLFTEKGCLKCHAVHGFKIGQIRGGISVAVPMRPFDDSRQAQLWRLGLGHSGLWLLGMLALALGGRRLQGQIDARRRAEHEVTTLSGLLPICSGCKKIRDDEQRWVRIDRYITEHSEAEFTHGLCPDCLERLYPEHTGDQHD